MNLQKFYYGMGALAGVLLAVCIVAILGLAAVGLVKALLVAVFS